jgi:hypothetical protein
VTSDASGNLTFTLAVPQKSTGGNPGVTPTNGDGVCAPTQNQENQGLVACTVQVSPAGLGGGSIENLGNALLEYPNQLSPQTPSVALSPTGTSTTTITATGTGWWGLGPGNNSIPAANIRIGCSGTNPCTGGVTAVSSTLTVSSPSYYETCTPTLCTGMLSPATLSGSFVMPNGASGTVAIDQPNTSPTPCPATAVCFAGNGPGNTVEATASSVLAAATATGTGVSTWNGNVPNNAISNSGNPPNPNLFWQPAAAATAPVTYQVNLAGSTTLSAVTTTWHAAFAPPASYTIDTSPDGTTWTTQVTISGNSLRTRTDMFPGGQVSAAYVRLTITSFEPPGSDPYAHLALVQFGWDGHGVAFPQAISPNTNVWNSGVFNNQLAGPVITGVIAAGINGTTTYDYVVTALNPVGETLASAEMGVTNGNASLSSSNFDSISWTTVPGATSYNVYGRTPGAETFLGNVPAPTTTLNDIGQALTSQFPPRPGTVPNNALYNPGNTNVFWQPTSAAAPGASYEVDLGSPTALSAVTTTWYPGFHPSAYEVDTSPDGVSWTPQLNFTANTLDQRTDVFPGGQVTASYLRLVINAPFPSPGAGYAGLALAQFSWNGVAATPTATPPESSLSPQAFSPGTAVWNGDVPNNVISNSGSPPNPNVWWQPTAAATAPVTYEVNLGQPTAVSAATTTWYPGYFPSAYEVDTSPDGATWSTQLSFSANTAASRTDVFPGGQVTVRYLRLLITAFAPAGGNPYATLALVQLGWDGHAVSFPQAYYPSTLPNSATANTTSTYQNNVPDNAFSGGPGGRTLTGGCATSGSTTIFGTGFATGDVGRPISGLGVGLGALVNTAYVHPVTGVTWTSGSTTLTGTGFVAGDVGAGVTGGTGLPACVTITAVSGTNATISAATTAAQTTATTVTADNVTASVASTATNSGVTLALGGLSWWQPTGAPGNTGNLTLAVDFGAPRSLSTLTATWYSTGYIPVNYQIWVSTDGTPNNWTVVRYNFSNSSSLTSDSFTTQANVRYVEYVITSWNSGSASYGPAMTSLTFS